MEIIIFETGGPRAELRDALTGAGHEVHLVARDAPELWADLVVLDAASWSANDVVRLAKRLPDAELLFLVGSLDAELPIEDGMALLEPVEIPKLLRLVRLLAEARSGRADPRDLVSFETLFSGDSPAIVDLLRQVRLVAQSDQPVSIYGELGSGRIVVARAIHERCMRQGRAFMAVNAAGFPGDQLDHHLFGGSEPSILRVAGGTLFIDFVTEISAAVQAKLLRIVEDKLFTVHGTDRPIDVRIMVGDDRSKLRVGGTLRPQLYYRLKVHELDLPPLRERAGDLKAIVLRMLHRLNDGREASLSSAATRALDAYGFPGNVRELAHALTHAAVLSQGRPIEVEHLPADIQPHAEPDEQDGSLDLETLESLDAVAKRFERTYLLRVLRAVGGNRTRAAKILDLSRKGLWQKLKAHGIAADEGREESEEELVIG
ncbi:MAG: sigma-54-dependent Fis family transcriptional regulator [Deltaproteobacteria bacterium]|nr:sigma-54-dependent Fis family transcriptional regulator [Deltaproteobacteria bacterium]